MLKDLCRLPLGYASEIVQSQKLFLPELGAIRTHHVAPEMPVLWSEVLEVDGNSPFCLAEGAARGTPALLRLSRCWLSKLDLGHFMSGRSAVKSGCSEAEEPRPRCGLGRFSWTSYCRMCRMCFTEVRRFYHRQGLHLRIT